MRQAEIIRKTGETDILVTLGQLMQGVPESNFLGYEQPCAKANVTAIVIDDELIASVFAPVEKISDIDQIYFVIELIVKLVAVLVLVEIIEPFAEGIIHAIAFGYRLIYRKLV